MDTDSAAPPLAALVNGASGGIGLAIVDALLARPGAGAVFASLSARVGSIGDNRLGGWYAYRASKAAQNMSP